MTIGMMIPLMEIKKGIFIIVFWETSFSKFCSDLKGLRMRRRVMSQQGADGLMVSESLGNRAVAGIVMSPDPGSWSSTWLISKIQDSENNFEIFLIFLTLLPLS